MKRIAAFFFLCGILCLALAQSQAQIPNVKIAGFGSHPPPVIAPQGNTTFSGAGASHTFTAMAIGTASANRYVVATMTFNNPLSAPTATIGGVTATLARGQSAGSGGAAIMYALVPTGTTADVVITPGGAVSRWGISTFSMTGWTGSKITTGAGGSNSLSLTLSLMKVAAVAGVVFSLNASGGDPSYGNVWTGLTEYQDTFFSTGNAGSAYGTPINPGTSISVTSSATSATSTVGVTVGFTN